MSDPAVLFTVRILRRASKTKTFGDKEENTETPILALSHEYKKAGEQTRYYLTESIRAYYNASSYVNVSPGFMYKFDDTTSTHYCKKPKWYYQAVLIALISWSIVIPPIADSYISKYSLWNTPKNNKSDQAFQFLLIIFWILNAAVVYHTFTTRTQGFSKLLDKTLSIERQLESVSRLRSNFVKHLAHYFASLALLWSFFSFVFVSYELHMYSFDETLRDQVYALQDRLHIDCNDALTNSGKVDDDKHPTNTCSLSVGALILSVGILLAKFKAEIAYYYALCALLVQAIVFYIIVRDFVAILKNNHMHKKYQVLKIFEEVCELSELIDQNMGPIVGLSCFEILTYFADLMNDLSMLNWNVVIQGVVYAFSRGLFLVIAAEANSMLSYLTFWLQNTVGKRAVVITNSCDSLEKENKKREEELERLLVTLSQLQSNKIGIRGRAFTVTHGFVGNMLSLLLSYTILLSQIKST